MIGRTLVVAKKELLQLRRDRLTLAMMAVLPVLQLLLFGYAINTDVRHVPTVVWDQNHSSQSREIWRSLEATQFFNLAGHVRNYDEVKASLRSGKAKVAIIFPADFSSQLKRGRGAPVQLIVDGSDPQSVASATSTAASFVNARAMQLLRLQLRTAGRASIVEPMRIEPVTWYNPDLRTAVYIVPGLVGVILTMTMVMLTSMAIARERERGTLEQLIVSPVRNLELITGKILPYVIIGYVQMTLILVAGRLIFHVPFVGSVWLLYALVFIFIAASLAVGLFFSTLAQTQQQAMQMSFFFLLPNILLSGFMFPHEAMPRPAQILSQALPLTHFLRIVRSIALKGGTFADISHEVVWLAAILFVLVLVSSLRFSKKLG